MKQLAAAIAAEIREELARLVRDELAGLRSSLVPSIAPARLLSMRAAAERLRVSRSRTLAMLIREKRIRVVMVNGRPRIPASEIERIEAEGTEPANTNGGLAKGPRSARRKAPLARDLV